MTRPIERSGFPYLLDCEFDVMELRSYCYAHKRPGAECAYYAGQRAGRVEEREWCAKTAEQSIDPVTPEILERMDAHNRRVTEVNNGTAEMIAQMIRQRERAEVRAIQAAHHGRTRA